MFECLHIAFHLNNYRNLFIHFCQPLFCSFNYPRSNLKIIGERHCRLLIGERYILFYLGPVRVPLSQTDCFCDLTLALLIKSRKLTITDR